MMTQKDLFAKALMVEQPWFVNQIKFDQQAGTLEIWIDFERGSTFYYKDEALEVNGLFKAYDTVEKSWRHLNFFQYKCILHAWIPRVDLGNGKVRLVKAPWEGISAGFTLIFEAFILELIRMMPVHQICQLMEIEDHKVWKMMRTYIDMARESEDFSNVKIVGIDETSARKNHNYVSLVVDFEEKRTIYVTEGKDSTVVEKFANDLKEHNGDPLNIEQISCDMSQAFKKGIEENLPNADIVFDKFHLIKIVNEAVDKVRKAEVVNNPLLKKTKYLFLKNNENLTENQKQWLSTIRLSGLNLKTVRALNIRESFQQIFHVDSPEEFLFLLKKWYFWATHSRIYEMKQVAYTIKRHWNGIVNWIYYKIANGILEGFNSIFQAAKAKARGYKRPDTIKAMIYLLTGKLDFSKINPYHVTHSN